MDSFNAALRYIFILSFILILVAYYVGTKAVATSFGTELTSIIDTATGRNAAGNFAGYAR